MSTLAVVEKILRETKVPMSVREIVERAGEALPTKSKTPDTVVARDLSMDIKRKGEASTFVRTSPGRYTMRELAQDAVTVAANTTNAAEAAGAAEATEVLSKAMRNERQATIAAKQGARRTPRHDTQSGGMSGGQQPG
jgi:hypothetical protein